MDSTPVFPAASPPVTDRAYRRISVAEYEEMIRAGIINEDEKVELLEGWIVEKLPKTPMHSYATQFMRDWFHLNLSANYFVNGQSPVVMLDSVPEPDLSVVRGVRRDYSKHHPRAANVPFILEVADASLGDDRVWKQRIYARAGVPIYWLINLVDGQVEVYAEPNMDYLKSAYREKTTYGLNDSVPAVIDGKEFGRLAVAELLP